jgi:hypothetical protein
MEKLSRLNMKKLRKRSILVIRRMLKQYNVSYSIADDKERLIARLAEIQFYSKKIAIYKRYDFSL